MSNVSQPENTTLQFGDNYGNIYHQGVLGSNLNNTPNLSSTFPTTPTDNSLGHYHYTDDGSSAVKFLNACGSGTGGHQFYTSNSTTAPVLHATINPDGMTIDNSTGILTQIANLNDNLTITTDTNVSVLSASDLTFDGVSVKDINVPTNTVLFSSDGTSITGNTNMTYSSFGGLDPTLQLGAPLSYTPTIQTEITASATYAGTYSAITTQNLNPNGSVNLYLSMDNATETSHYTVLGLNNSTYDGAPYITEAVEMTYLSSLEGGIAIAPNFNGNSNKYNAVHLGYAGGTKAVSILADGSLSLNTEYSAGDWTGNVGTAGDILTSGGVGQPAVWGSTISLLGVGENNQVLTYIDGNCGWADLPIDPEITELKIKQINPLQVYNSSSVYQDGKPPIAVPTTIGNNFGQFGWYFKNSFTSGNKINWYQVADIGMKVSDVIGLYMRYFNCGSIGVNDIPYIAIYTKTDTITPNAASWYKSRLVLVPNFTPTVNTSYTTQYKFSTTPDASHYNSTLKQMIYSTVGTNPTGAYAPTELINFFAISTSSSSSMNASEFIFQKLGIQTAQGTTEFLYQPLL